MYQTTAYDLGRLCQVPPSGSSLSALIVIIALAALVALAAWAIFRIYHPITWQTRQERHLPPLGATRIGGAR